MANVLLHSRVLGDMLVQVKRGYADDLLEYFQRCCPKLSKVCIRAELDKQWPELDNEEFAELVVWLLQHAASRQRPNLQEGETMEKDLLEKVKEATQDANVQAKRLGKALAEVAKFLGEIGLPRCKAHNIEFEPIYPCSNIGCYGPNLRYAPRGSIASTSAKPNSDYHLHGDLNTWVRVATLSDRMYVAEHLPEFLEEVAQRNADYAGEMRDLANAIQDALTAIEE